MYRPKAFFNDCNQALSIVSFFLDASTGPLPSYHSHQDGEWWLEFSRLMTARDVAAVATARGFLATGETVGPERLLPPDFSPGHEVLRALQREHCRWD